MRMRWLATALMVFTLTACGDDQDAAEAPPPVAPTREAITYFGRMILVDHQGPKAQIHLESQEEPLWFPAVRDAYAFTVLPGEARDITAIYVTDMAASEGWDNPQVWVPTAAAVYVIRSDRTGGMGMPEAVPFTDPAVAEAFIADHGGEIVAWDAIPEDYVLGEGEETTPTMSHSGGGH